MKLYYATDRYVADNSLAIRTYAMDEEFGFLEPYGDVTVCLIDYDLTPEEGTIFMPTYKMFGEFLETVMDDIVDEVLGTIQIGFGQGFHVRLKEDWQSQVEMVEWF